MLKQGWSLNKKHSFLKCFKAFVTYQDPDSNIVKIEFISGLSIHVK